MSLSTKLLAVVVAFVGLTGGASAGVLPPIEVPEPMTLTLLSAGVGVLYLVKKLRS